MASRRSVFLGSLIGAASAALAAAAVAAASPGPTAVTGYAWAQPGTAAVAVPDAQPPAWIPVG
jgi:hypothetical protein